MMMEPKTLFIEKRISDAVSVIPGVGILTVDVPFVPDYIKVRYLDTCRKSTLDELTYDLLFTGDPSSPYQLVMSWSVASGRRRRFKYIVAKLSSFHNGAHN